MAAKFVALFAAILIMTVKTRSTCQGTQCTLEDLEDLETNANLQVLQNLTSTIGDVFKNQLRIHVVHDYSNCSREAANPASFLSTHAPRLARDCNDIVAQGHNTSGVYTVQPIVHPVAQTEAGEMKFDVYCDLENDGGGWTVFQRREDGSVNFYRGWEGYKAGFGYFESEFWLGLERLHRLTTQARYELRVNLEDADGNKAYARYDKFRIGDELTSYKLILGAYEGTAGDSMGRQNKMKFTTKDRDNDLYSQNCALSYKGAWWYEACHNSNLNGLYLEPGTGESSAEGIAWYRWYNDHRSLKSPEMKIRRLP